MQGWPQEALGKSRRSLSRGGKELWVVRRGPRKERRLRCCPSWGTAPDLPQDTREPLAFLRVPPLCLREEDGPGSPLLRAGVCVSVRPDSIGDNIWDKTKASEERKCLTYVSNIRINSVYRSIICALVNTIGEIFFRITWAAE